MALHLDIPTQQQLTALLAARATPSVSLYLPTGHLPHDEAVARIELKNLAHEALTQIEAAGLPSAEVREHLDDLHDDEEFWTTQAVSLAVFATPDGVRTFRLPNRLTTLVEVSDRYHLKPLLRSVTFPQAAFVLALAQGSVRLIEVAAEVPAEEVRIADLPGDVASAVGKASITDRSAVGRIQGSEGQKVRMRQYARQVDAALRPALGAAGVPLILAGAEPLESIYRSVNSYPFLAPQTIQGNPETATPAELAEEARGVLDAIYAEELAELRRLFDQRGSQGRAAVELTDIARAATYGAVQTLMADMDDVLSGFVDEESGAVTLDGGDDARNYGVVDEIARRVLAHDGRVLALRREDIPGGGTAAAILRYPA
jgi:hypothetical protein